MKTPWLLAVYIGMAGCTLPIQATPYNSTSYSDTKEDSVFFAHKHKLLTAQWDYPFSYSEIRSKHAPLGPYLGNGDIGAVAFTSDNSQTLRISKVDFVTDQLSDWAGKGAAALPVGGISITIHSPVQPANNSFSYKMDLLHSELSMHTATAQPVEMKTWMTMGDNFIITELTTPSPYPISISVDTYADNHNLCYPASSCINGLTAQVKRQTKQQHVKWKSEAGISTCIQGATPTVCQLSQNIIRQNFKITSSKPVYIVSKISGGGKEGKAELKDVSHKLSQIGVTEIRQMKTQKEQWWKRMWYRSYVETHDSLLDRHYLSSIYLLASAYNEFSPVAGGMYGVWNMDDEMMYHGDIHLNYNSQAAFYSVFSANRPEIALPFYKSIELLIPEGKRRAQEEMGLMHPSWKGKSCRGILFPVSALGIGEFYGEYWQQTMNAPFNVPLFSWYYEYTGDMDFLRNRAYPYIRLCGDFYEDYLQKEKYQDSYRYNITTGAHEGSWDLNPPSDLAFVEQTFTLLVKYSKILGVDHKRRKLWEDILSHLPDYKVIMPTQKPNQGLPVFAKNEDGWDLPSHVIQLHPVYPCEVLDLNSDSTQLEIARNTLYYYLISQKGYDLMNELGLSAYIMGSRIGFNPELLIEKMKYQIKKAGKNMLITDGHHCTEKTTVIETINSMMLQTLDGVIHLFPCWPEKAASFTRLRSKGAFLVSSSYDGKEVRKLTVHSEQGNLCKIKKPWELHKIQIVCNGKNIAYKEKEGVIYFPTQKGKTYMICPLPES